MRRFIALCALLLLGACAGTPFKWSQARQIKTGMTTDEVKSIMGAPYSVTSRDGALLYVWVQVNPLTFATNSLRVDFKEGRVISAPPIPDEFQD